MTMFNAAQKSEALHYLNSVTCAYANPAQLGVSPIVSLECYLDLIHKIHSRKSFRIFTNNPTAFPHPTHPNLYITNLGNLVLKVIFDNPWNPFTTGKFQNALIHPEIALLSELFFKYYLNNIHINNYQFLEHYCEMCFADFKVQTQTRAITTRTTSWENRHGTLGRTYNRFLEFIYSETDKFEVHSIIIQRQLRHGYEPTFGDPKFRDLSAHEIVKEKSSQIINEVWRNRNKINVLGILSRQEMNIEQTQSIKLIFFVKKEFSDLIAFNETPLYQQLQPYLMSHDLDHVILGNTPTMSSGLKTLYQGQEHNYYDLSQITVGHRLDILKAQLVAPDRWFRLRDNTSSLIVERGRNEYHR